MILYRIGLVVVLFFILYFVLRSKFFQNWWAKTFSATDVKSIEEDQEEIEARKAALEKSIAAKKARIKEESKRLKKTTGSK